MVVEKCQDIHESSEIEMRYSKEFIGETLGTFLLVLFGCDRSTLSREGLNATVIGGWDFGYVNTNGSGYGKDRFTLTPPPGTYYIQFTVRIGDKCDPTSGQTSGCAAVYRTGSKMGRGFEVINIP